MPYRAEPLPLPSTPLSVPDTEGAVTRRALGYGGLALLLGGGLAARFGAGGLAGAPAGAGAREGVLPFASLDAAHAEQALAGSTIPADQRPAILAAVRERRMHLIQAPFFGVGATVGRAVTVSCGLVSVPLVLGAEPVAVLLPITRAATIVVTATGAAVGADDAIGVVTALGARPLPAPDSGHTLQIDVVVQ